MISIKLDRGNKMVVVRNNDKLVSADTVNDGEFKELMHELIDQTDVSVSQLRKITKLFEIKSFEFKGDIK